jgi:hypothetical protein
MSRSIAQNILDKLVTNQITTFHLLKFTVNEVEYFYTDAEVPIYSDADGTDQTYLPQTFSFDNINYSNNNIIDSCSLKIDNINEVMTALFIGNTIVDEEAILYMIIFEDDNSIINTQQIFTGVLNDFNIDESELNIALTSEFTKWDQNSNIKHSALCRWKEFKGVECAYAGGETICDRTYARCVELSNTDQFGGFRWLPAQEDIDVWWGPIPSIGAALDG